MDFLINLKSNINKFLRINYLWFFSIIVFALFQSAYWYLNKKNLIDLSKVDHNAILTINLTLAGFLLTGIGIMISIRDKAFIQTLIRAGYWRKIEKSNFLGIAFNIISALISLGSLIVKHNNSIIFNVEIFTFILGLTYFVIVVIWLKKALNYI